MIATLTYQGAFVTIDSAFRNKTSNLIWVLIHLFARSKAHTFLFSSQQKIFYNRISLLSVKLLNNASFQRTSCITWMWLKLEHPPCTTSLIVSLNVSAILRAFPLTALPPKERMENFGAIFSLLISTETSESTMKTSLRITFSLW